jgi:hypothetical protein
VAERVGRVWRVTRASMPSRLMCGAQGRDACMLQNGDAALGVQTMHERGQGAGWGVANGRRGRQPSIGHRRRWLGGPGGEVAGGCLPATPRSA